MTYLKTIWKQESSNLGKDDIDDLIILRQDRDIASTGLFQSDGSSPYSTFDNNSKTPYKLISYDVKVWTSLPCLLWSSEYGALEMVQGNPPGADDTNIIAENVANGIIKKFTLTDHGRTWSRLGKKFQYSYNTSGKWHRGGKARYMRDNKFKLQIQNLDPQTETQNASYYAIVTVEVDYDA